jgi:hypothetical protein
MGVRGWQQGVASQQRPPDCSIATTTCPKVLFGVLKKTGMSACRIVGDALVQRRASSRERSCCQRLLKPGADPAEAPGRWDCNEDEIQQPQTAGRGEQAAGLLAYCFSAAIATVWEDNVRLSGAAGTQVE